MTAKFQHRHYEAIAAMVRNCPANEITNNIHSDPVVWRSLERGAIAVHSVAALAADNPRFDRARFLRACGVEE